MLEDKLIVGRYLNIIIPPDAPGLLGAFITQVAIHKTIEQSSGFSVGTPWSPRTPRSSNVVDGVGAKLRRNFIWLNYVPGSINEVPSNGIDVLTGPMSGCWVTKYLRGGVEHIGHVGTTHPGSDETVAAKAAWNHFAQINGHDVIGGFQPTWNGAYPPSHNLGRDREYQFALVTPTGYFTVATWREGNNFRIAGVQRDWSATLDTLQHI